MKKRKKKALHRRYGRSDKPEGFGVGRCDVCGRVNTWGCGHSGSQESAARKHRTSRTHKERRCECYGHDHCDPRKCKLAGIHISGYAPFHQHTEPKEST